MKRSTHLAIFLAVFSVIICKPHLCHALTDAIAAIVNDSVITLQDIKSQRQTIYLQLRSRGYSEEEAERVMASYADDVILEQIIENQLLISAADELGLEIRPAAVNEQINKIKNQYPSEKIFLDSLIEEGLTLTDLRNKITDQLKAKYIIDVHIRNKIFVNPQEVTEYYQENPEKFQKPMRFDLESIFIASEDNPAAAREKAAEALQAIKNGDDFLKVAQEYSEAPSLGIIEETKLLPEIADIIRNLKEGEVSPLIETDSGAYIFKLKKRYDTETASLAEAREKIYNYLFQQKFRRKLTAWLDELRGKAYIEIKHE